MFKPTRTILAMTLLALAGTAVAASPADKNADKVVMLPASAMLAIEGNPIRHHQRYRPIHHPGNGL